jgi:hypothetical protein
MIEPVSGQVMPTLIVFLPGMQAKISSGIISEQLMSPLKMI